MMKSSAVMKYSHHAFRFQSAVTFDLISDFNLLIADLTFEAYAESIRFVLPGGLHSILAEYAFDNFFKKTFEIFNGGTFLHYCIEKGRLKFVEQILNLTETDVNVCDSMGLGALEVAMMVYAKQPDMLELFVNADNMKINSRAFLRLLDLRDSNKQLVEALLQQGKFDLNIQDFTNCCLMDQDMFGSMHHLLEMRISHQSKEKISDILEYYSHLY